MKAKDVLNKEIQEEMLENEQDRVKIEGYARDTEERGKFYAEGRKLADTLHIPRKNLKLKDWSGHRLKDLRLI